MSPELYFTKVHHRRLIRPFHSLSYRVAFLGFDLADIEGLKHVLKRTPYAVRPTDYGHNNWADLAKTIRVHALQENHTATGKIKLITLPRLFGRGFNPISLFIIHDADDGPAAIVYDVRNTFGDRHYYAADLGSPRHTRRKQFHVSPFLDNDGTYRFNLTYGSTRLHLGITKQGHDGPELYARMDGEARPATRQALWRAALSLPTQGLMILAAIHWEALKLWAKGALYFSYRKNKQAPMITDTQPQLPR